MKTSFVRWALVLAPAVSVWCLPAAQAQVVAPSRPVDVTSDDPFYTTNQMDHPAPSRVRSSNGHPGPEYWQQRADYTIAVTLDTATRTLEGTVTIRYTNNSPDALPFVWLQLDQNLYKSTSWGSALFAADSRWGARNFEGGYALTNVRVNGAAATYTVDDTRMRLELPRPLTAKGGVATISMGFSFNIPDHGSDRLGRDGTLYEIAQWYPRMAVYDDIRGWNTEPYLGQGEFYLEYGDITYSVTAPAGYTIAGSGVLQNPALVLTAAQRSRLAKAAKSEVVVQIIPDAEAVAVSKSGTKTWRFVAENVRDVAWAGAPDFRWDAVACGSAGRPVLCQAYYQIAKAGKAWEAGAEQTQYSIRHYSDLLIPYPYPQATSVAGPVGGMEYPMFVMVHYGEPKEDPNSIFGTLDHEHGHEWFPMIVGSNERRYAWMDEGFNTYINVFASERRFPNSRPYSNYLTNWRNIRNRGIDVPLMTAPDHIAASALGAIGYRKPGVVMLTLRNHVVGRETFDAAFRAYTKAWAFKHPTPADFFRFIENYAGADLSWFWRNFFYTNAVLDIAVDSVTHDQNGAGIVLRNVTGVPFPVMARVKYASGRTTDVRTPVDVWYAGSRFVLTVPETSSDAVVGVRLWPDPSVPDWDDRNDVWGNAPARDPMRPMTVNK